MGEECAFDGTMADALWRRARSTIAKDSEISGALVPLLTARLQGLTTAGAAQDTHVRVFDAVMARTQRAFFNEYSTPARDLAWCPVGKLRHVMNLVGQRSVLFKELKPHVRLLGGVADGDP